MKKGWFAIPGVQSGDRTLEEQMLGLQPALEHARGKTVCDLGCAEGLIALEFAAAGATVMGYDLNADLIRVACQMRDQRGLRDRVRFECVNLNDLVEREQTAESVRQYDIVLALAVVHKMADPQRVLRYLAGICRERAVIRLPQGSSGFFRTKHHNVPCDVNRVLQESGLRLDGTAAGPRGEQVQHWIKD